MSLVGGCGQYFPFPTMVRSIVLACSSSSALDSVIYDMQVAAKKGEGRKYLQQTTIPFPEEKKWHSRIFSPSSSLCQKWLPFPPSFIRTICPFFLSLLYGEKGLVFSCSSSIFLSHRTGRQNGMDLFFPLLSPFSAGRA